MSDLQRFGVSVDEELLREFDVLIDSQGYANRSEALRDLMRDALIKSKTEDSPENSEVVASLTLIYDHHARELADKMTDIQHAQNELVVSVMHVHINHHDCLEVIILRGKLRQIRLLADTLLSLKGVKHGKLFVTLPAREIGGKIKKSSAAKHQH